MPERLYECWCLVKAFTLLEHLSWLWRRRNAANVTYIKPQNVRAFRMCLQWSWPTLWNASPPHVKSLSEVKWGLWDSRHVRFFDSKRAISFRALFFFALSLLQLALLLLPPWAWLTSHSLLCSHHVPAQADQSGSQISQTYFILLDFFFFVLLGCPSSVHHHNDHNYDYDCISAPHLHCGYVVLSCGWCHASGYK